LLCSGLHLARSCSDIALIRREYPEFGGRVQPAQPAVLRFERLAERRKRNGVVVDFKVNCVKRASLGGILDGVIGQDDVAQCWQFLGRCKHLHTVETDLIEGALSIATFLR